jgi:hypothetical protein
MKTTGLIFILSICIGCSFGQTTSEAYMGLVGKADSLYDAKDYKTSAFTYSAAFKVNDWKANSTDRYNAACSWSLAGYPDSAFSNLENIAANANYYNYDHITTDPDLKTLYADKRWQPLLGMVKRNQEKAEANFNKPIVAELKQVLQDDQGLRGEIDSVSKKYGYNSPQMKQLWAEMSVKDSLNLIKVTAILDKYGWLGPDAVGNSGAITLFLVIQHADQGVQEKYLPMMREAVKNGKALGGNLALLEDRVALEEGKKQIYGSQVGRDEKTGKFYIRPIEDEINVDKRRASVGLPPLRNYVKQWNIDYIPPTK